MKSPINKESTVTIERKIKVSTIIDAYKKYFSLDVTKYFKNLVYIYIYICKDTGYRFYYPFDISGDSDFYIHFQKFDWYYMSWKWEHEICLKLIDLEDEVLEVGCGKGYFLEKVNKIKNAKCIGLELNESAVLRREKFEIINTSIEEFAKKNKEQFDVVCSFQVLEHISHVHSFLDSKISCLKKGGKLVICVPNNDSYIKYVSGVLNRPPHHMGLWGEKSLRRLENFYPIKLDQILFEPLQSYHAYDYLYGMLRKYLGTFLTKGVLKIVNIIGFKKKIENFILNRTDSIKGHSIMAVFVKS